MPSLAGYPSCHDCSTLGEFQRVTEAKTLNAGLSTATDLTVMTADGDKVTFSQKSTASLAYADYNYLSRTPGQTTSYRENSLEFDLQNQVQVSVEGDLSQQERADLDKLIKKLEKVIKKFLKGDVDGAVAKALQINKLGSLSSVDLSMEYTRSLTVTRQQTVEVSDAEPSNPADDPAPTSMADLIRQIVKAVKDSKINPEKLQRHLPNSIASLLRTLDLVNPDQSPKQSVSEFPAKSLSVTA